MKKLKKRKIVKNENEETTFLSVLLQSVCFIPFFAIVSFGMILLFSWIFYRFSDPTSKISLAGIIALCFSVFISSAVLSIRHKQKYLLRGTVFGLISIILILATSLFVKDTETSNSNYVFSLLPLLCSVIGSFIASKFSQKKKRHHKY